MKPGSTGKGLEACEAALQRLLNGKPIRPEHVGLELSKLTAGVVSFEAGFDRGYLKKARQSHQAIIAKIEAYRLKSPVSSVRLRELDAAKTKLSTTKNELEEAFLQRDDMLARNLQLMQQLKKLEREVVELRRSAGKKGSVAAFSGADR